MKKRRSANAPSANKAYKSRKKRKRASRWKEIVPQLERELSKYCPDTRKRRYLTEAAALRGLESRQEQITNAGSINLTQRNSTDLWVYQCPSCESWHLTSSPQNRIG